MANTVVVNALLRDMFRKERIPIGVSSGDIKRKVHQFCKDFGISPEAMGKEILPILDEMIEETRDALHHAFES